MTDLDEAPRAGVRTNLVLADALTYAQAVPGLRVGPWVKAADGRKLPLGKPTPDKPNGSGFDDWSNDPKAIRLLCNLHPEADGVGHVPGSGGFDVADLDVKGGAPGPEWFARAATAYGDDPEETIDTASVTTPSGGRHLYYDNAAGLDLGQHDGKLTFPDGTVQGETGVDNRSGDGFVPLPPIEGPANGYTYDGDRPFYEVLRTRSMLTVPGWFAVAWPSKSSTKASGTVQAADVSAYLARYNAGEFTDPTLKAAYVERIDRLRRTGSGGRHGEVVSIMGHLARDLGTRDVDAGWILAETKRALAVARAGEHRDTDYEVSEAFTAFVAKEVAKRSALMPDVVPVRPSAGTPDTTAPLLNPDGSPVNVAASPGASAAPVPDVLARALANANLIDWSTAWDDDHEEAWALYPLVPKGRSVVVYGANGVGKSEAIEAGIVPAVLGLPVYGQRAADPISVLVLDLEMGKPDGMLRLDHLGYGPEHAGAFSARLHYAALPNLSPLDTPAGAEEILALALHFAVDLVMIDTFMKALQGGENDADTFHAFTRLTANRLKEHGIAVLRLDHSGHDGSHERGSSAKGGDPDVKWKLSRTHRGTKLEREKERVSWGPSTVVLDRVVDAEGVLRYTLDSSSSPTFGEHAQADAAILDRLGVPFGAGRPEARKALTEAEITMSNVRLAEAVKWRKMSQPLFTRGPSDGADSPADSPDSGQGEQVPGHLRTPPTENGVARGETALADRSADRSGHPIAGLSGQVGGSNEVTPHPQPPSSRPDQLPLDGGE